MRIGAPYKILNQVVEFEEGRRIAWRHFGGHIWRYILEPLGPNATQVTEQFDPSASRPPRVLKVHAVAAAEPAGDRADPAPHGRVGLEPLELRSSAVQLRAGTSRTELGSNS